MHFHDCTFNSELFHTFQFGFCWIHSTCYQYIVSIIDVLPDAVCCSFRCIGLDGHFSQFVTNRTIFRNRTTKLLTFIGVIHSSRNALLATTNCSCSQLDSSDVQDIHRDLKSVLTVRKHVLHWHHAVVQKHLNGR